MEEKVLVLSNDRCLVRDDERKMGDCPLCKSKTNRILMEVKGYPILECDSCSHVFTGLPDDFDPASLYSEEFWHSEKKDVGYKDYFADQEKTLRKCAARLKKICAFLGRSKGNLLDYGCGPGFFLKTAKDRGWDVFGIDLSPFAVDYARNNLGIVNIHCDSLIPKEWRQNTFDVITLWAVIEHLPDPLETLKTLIPYLKSDGLLCLSTGNWNSIAARNERERWRLMTPPGHLHYFSRKSLEFLLNACSLQIVKLRTNDYFGEQVQGCLKIKLIRKLLRFMGKGDIMTVYIRKIIP